MAANIQQTSKHPLLLNFKVENTKYYLQYKAEQAFPDKKISVEVEPITERDPIAYANSGHVLFSKGIADNKSARFHINIEHKPNSGFTSTNDFIQKLENVTGDKNRVSSVSADSEPTTQVTVTSYDIDKLHSNIMQNDLANLRNSNKRQITPA